MCLIMLFLVFLLLTRASAKERIKSGSYSEQNKACQRCMLCKSMSFCPSCSQCPQCCHRTECRGKVTNVLASLARNGHKSSGDFCLEGGLHPSIQTETPIDKVPHSSEWLCKSSKEPVFKGSLTKSPEQVGSRKGDYQVVSGFLQPAFPCLQTKQKMETNLGPQSVELIPQYQYLQDGNSGDNLVILADRGMGDITGLQRRVFPHSNKSKVTKISEVFPVQSNLPIHSSSLWSGHSSSQVYQGGQRSEACGSSKGYQDPPVPRRLVVESPVPGNLPTTHPDPFGTLPAIRVGGKHEKIRANTATGLSISYFLLALKSFEHLYRDQIVLVATDNTTVVAYINKQGGMKSGSLCALL